MFGKCAVFHLKENSKNAPFPQELHWKIEQIFLALVTHWCFCDISSHYTNQAYTSQAYLHAHVLWTNTPIKERDRLFCSIGLDKGLTVNVSMWEWATIRTTTVWKHTHTTVYYLRKQSRLRVPGARERRKTTAKWKKAVANPIRKLWLAIVYVLSYSSSLLPHCHHCLDGFLVVFTGIKMFSRIYF